MAFVILFWEEVGVLSVIANTMSGLQDSVYERQSAGVTFFGGEVFKGGIWRMGFGTYFADTAHAGGGDEVFAVGRHLLCIIGVPERG